MKEASDNIWLFLQTAEVRDRLHLHALLGQVLEFSHDSGFEVSPDPFIRIEFGRVAGQQVKRDLPVEGFHETSDLLRLVRGVPVDDQEYPPLGAVSQALDEFNELVRANRALHHHEPKLASGTDRRDHVEAKPRTRRFDNRSLAFRCPGGSRVVVGPDSCFVAEVDFPLATGGGALDGRELILKPLVDGFRILLVSPPKRTLRREAELVEQAAYGCLTELDAVLLLDEGGDHLPGPQRESELELERVAHRDGGIDPLEHLPIKLGFAPAPLASLELVPSPAAVKCQPIVDGRSADTKCLGDQLGTFAVLHGTDPADSQFRELRVRQLPAVCIPNFSHAA